MVGGAPSLHAKKVAFRTSRQQAGVLLGVLGVKAVIVCTPLIRSDIP